MVLLAKPQPGWFGLTITSAGGGASPAAGQVVVGHQHRSPRAWRVGHALDAGDAVVDGDQHVGAAAADARSTIGGVRP